MPISIKRDVKPAYGLGDRFSLRDTPFYVPLRQEPILFGDIGGLYMNAVRPRIADENWYQFYRSWNLGLHTEREVAKSIAGKFNLEPADEDSFDELWDLAAPAKSYKTEEHDGIARDIADAYALAARAANGEDVDGRTFDRSIVRRDANLVIFSDHHMTAYERLPNAFRDFNYALYLDVLDHYAATDFCLVENGDVEECIIYEPDIGDSRARRKAAPTKDLGGIAFPVRLSDPDWDAFLDLRYAKRETTQGRVIAEFQAYYELLRTRFIPDRYVRLSGNHDAYLDQERERVLRDRLEAELRTEAGLGVEVHDVLRIERAGQVEYVVMHGHQFDPACTQHGAIPYAKSLGEMFSECLGWAYQGPDRVWDLSDTKRWFVGSTYQNVLAREEPGTYLKGGKGFVDLLGGALKNIKSDSKDFIETLMGAEIAWEYFENEDAFHALTLEVWTGDEMYKMKHMNEVALCTGYVEEFLKLQPQGVLVPIPKLVLGHTHEPRQNAVFPSDPREKEPWERGDTGAGAFYLNSGSAGRYENLIWCVEIRGSEDRICSWSRMDGKLKKITWRSDGDRLVHDVIEWPSG